MAFVKRYQVLLTGFFIIAVAIGGIEMRNSLERHDRYIQDRRQKVSAMLRLDGRLVKVRYIYWKGRPTVVGTVATEQELAKLKVTLAEAGLSDVRILVMIGNTLDERLEYESKQLESGSTR
jgi:hypothetical protein